MEGCFMFQWGNFFFKWGREGSFSDGGGSIFQFWLGLEKNCNMGGGGAPPPHALPLPTMGTPGYWHIIPDPSTFPEEFHH